MPSFISTRRSYSQPASLNGSTKAVALVGAALLLLDFAATAVVSAATASSYLAGEVTLPFPLYVGALLVFVLFTAVGLLGLRESARIASGVLAFHVCVSLLFRACVEVKLIHGRACSFLQCLLSQLRPSLRGLLSELYRSERTGSLARQDCLRQRPFLSRFSMACALACLA